jgi:hypothetical protein
MPVDPQLLEILACPQCKGELRYIDSESVECFDCLSCQLRFRVEDGIPNFLIDEAEPLPAGASDADAP